MSVSPVTINGKAYVILERGEYEALKSSKTKAELPQFPARDEYGHYPAVAYARVSIARDIIQGRLKAGLTQKALANLAGIRVETLCRIETGKHTPSVATIDRIEGVLKPVKKKYKGRVRKAATNSRS